MDISIYIYIYKYIYRDRSSDYRAVTDRIGYSLVELKCGSQATPTAIHLPPRFYLLIHVQRFALDSQKPWIYTLTLPMLRVQINSRC